MKKNDVRGAVIRAVVLMEAEKADFRRSGLLDEGSGRRQGGHFWTCREQETCSRDRPAKKFGPQQPAPSQVRSPVIYDPDAVCSWPWLSEPSACSL